MTDAEAERFLEQDLSRRGCCAHWARGIPYQRLIRETLEGALDASK